MLRIFHFLYDLYLTPPVPETGNYGDEPGDYNPFA